MSLIPKTQLDQLWGAARVHTDGTSTSTTGFREGAISATSRSGAGVYVITLSAGMGVDAQENVCGATTLGVSAAAVDVQIVQDTDNQFTVSTFVAGAPADRAFYFWVRKVRSLNG